jgi:hypothetical protein
MQRFDLIALKAALPPNTQVIVTGGVLNLAEVRIGNPPIVEVRNDTEPYSEMTAATKVTGIDEQGRHTTEDTPVARWPAGVTSAEEMLAFTYWTTLLQQTLGADAYVAAEKAGALPAWSPGASLASVTSR